jgi:hypothetical protein
MSSLFSRNQLFLDNIYRHGPFAGHGFICLPPREPLHQHPYGDYTLSDQPVSHWVESFVHDYEAQVQLTEQVGDDNVPVAKLVTATHLYAAAFGSPIKTYEDNNPCALPFVSTLAEADAVPEPEIWKSPTLYRVFELGEALRRELGPEAYLGPCDMQTGFDTACLIWEKTSMFLAMCDPEGKAAVKRLADKCARLLTTFLQELRREFPTMSPLHCPGCWCPPNLGPWVSNDECGTVSTAMFEEFMLPELIDLAETFGSVGMHCCADAEHQFASFRRIPNFYGFNRVAARQGWLTILEELDGPGAPVHVLAWLPEETITALITQAHPATRFIFVNLNATPETAAPWLERMRALSPRGG